MTEKQKLTIKKPLSLEKQSQLFEILKPLQDKIEKGKKQKAREAKQQKKEEAPSKSKLRDALTFYTNNIHYLEAVIKGTYRYDLEGHEIQEITPEQKMYAQEKFEATLQMISKRKEHKNKFLYQENTDNSFQKE